MKSREANTAIPTARASTLTVPLTSVERDALDTLKAQGFQKGHWVAQAIREKLQREGLLEPERP